MAEAEGQFEDAYLYVDKKFSVNNLRSSLTRFIIYAGLPLEGYANDRVDEEDQADDVSDFYVDEYKNLLLDADIDDGDVWYIGPGVTSDEILGYLMQDLILTVPSFCFVFIFM